MPGLLRLQHQALRRRRVWGPRRTDRGQSAHVRYYDTRAEAQSLAEAIGPKLQWPAGTMVLGEQKEAGLRHGMVGRIVLAWIIALPVTIALSAGLFYLLNGS